ncbi:DUF6718 family protein [uncultured Clostridium sp.]|uniref:DUF6718 family protein n=1 Tax=uncultured Clostridium sp. TaxID=59620 RepID=UPI00338E0AFC
MNIKKVIITKKFNEVGSIILDIDNLEKMNNRFDYLVEESFDSDVQIVSKKGIENYQEYYPITVINDSKTFTKRDLNYLN